jgi:TIR domain
MSRIEKTVFISYRRTNAPWALAVFKDLTQHGYDAFFDFTGIASGDFERVILENIRARAHFLVLLTPSALERCGESGDWLRREIETALGTKRNIVPLMLEGFDFSTPSIASQLTGKLVALKQSNALRVPADFFDEAMSRLRQKYLNVPLEAVFQPSSASAQQAAEAQQAAASAAPAVAQKELTRRKSGSRKEIMVLARRKKYATLPMRSALSLIIPELTTTGASRGARRATSMARLRIITRRFVCSLILPSPITTEPMRGRRRVTSMARLQIIQRRSGLTPMILCSTGTGALRGAPEAAKSDFQKFLNLGGGDFLDRLESRVRIWWPW